MKSSKNQLLLLLFFAICSGVVSQTQTSNIITPQAASLGENWSCIGPEQVLMEGGQYGLTGSITKVDIADSNEQIIVAGTESGEVYRSIDGGNNWSNISLDLFKNSSLTMLKIHPQEEDHIYIGYGSYVLFSDNAGNTWTNIFQYDNLHPRELYIDQSSPSLLLASSKGTFHSSDQGQNWVQTSQEEVYDLLALNQDQILILDKDQADGQIKVKSTGDQGLSFNTVIQSWDDEPIEDFLGGKLAYSEANPDELFIYLIGQQKAGDNGFLGLWRYELNNSELYKAYEASPYSIQHPNPATLEYNSSTHKGFEYCHLIANPQQGDQLLLGALNLFNSPDKGQSLHLNNYISQTGPEFYKLRVRDMIAKGGTSIIATDGGLYKSADFFQSDNYELISIGINNAYCFDFAQAWNEDVIITSLKDNGNNARLETYPAGTFVYLGGSENTFLGINPYNSQQSFFAELNEVYIPGQTTSAAIINENNFTIDPEGSKQAVESTELRFDPQCYNIAYTGVSNRLMKSSNGGRSFSVLHTFNPAYKITEIEISRQDRKLIYLSLQHESVLSKSCKLFKSTDGGASWAELNIPNQGQDKHILLELDASDEDRLFIAFKHPYSGNRIYESGDGGSSWSPISSNGIPQNDFIHALCNANGYQQGLHIFTNRSAYLFDGTEWNEHNLGLPKEINSSAAEVFYRDGKLRLSSYGKGLWEYTIEQEQTAPIANISVDKFEKNQLCDNGTIFYFMDYSMAEKEAFERVWHFEDGEIIDDQSWNKRSVLFNTAGEKTAKLQLIDKTGAIVAEDSLLLKIGLVEIAESIDIDFEDNSLGTGLHVHNSNGDITWKLIEGYGGYGNSNSCFWLNNFNNMNMGTEEVITFRVDLSTFENAFLEFDIAYSRFPCLEDQLNVFGSSCEHLSGELLRTLGADEMKSTERQEGAFFPFADEWKTIKIPLSDYTGNERTFLQIKSVNEYGNNIFIDNITISED